MRPLFQNVDCSCDAQPNSFNGRKSSSGQVDSRFGIPITLLSEKGQCFAINVFQALTKALGVKHVFTSAYRPTTNGQVERWNKTLVDTLTHFDSRKGLVYLPLSGLCFL
jgi:transposase InsO family protein